VEIIVVGIVCGCTTSSRSNLVWFMW